MTRQQPTRRYPRKVRVDELFRQILAHELERIDDDRLYMVTITGMDVDPDLRRAVVWFDALDDTRDNEIIEAFGELRHVLQKSLARQSTTKHTPVLTFQPDVAIRTGERIERMLAEQRALIDNRPPDPEPDDDELEADLEADDDVHGDGAP
jgi:ribosome-binding factor A